jgi:hypothetical protein
MLQDLTLELLRTIKSAEESQRIATSLQVSSVPDPVSSVLEQNMIRGSVKLNNGSDFGFCSSVAFKMPTKSVFCLSLTFGTYTSFFKKVKCSSELSLLQKSFLHVHTKGASSGSV